MMAISNQIDFNFFLFFAPSQWTIWEIWKRHEKSGKSAEVGADNNWKKVNLIRQLAISGL